MVCLLVIWVCNCLLHSSLHSRLCIGATWANFHLAGTTEGLYEALYMYVRQLAVISGSIVRSSFRSLSGRADFPFFRQYNSFSTQSYVMMLVFWLTTLWISDSSEFAFRTELFMEEAVEYIRTRFWIVSVLSLPRSFNWLCSEFPLSDDKMVCCSQSLMGCRYYSSYSSAWSLVAYFYLSAVPLCNVWGKRGLKFS